MPDPNRDSRRLNEILRRIVDDRDGGRLRELAVYREMAPWLAKEIAELHAEASDRTPGDAATEPDRAARVPATSPESGGTWFGPYVLEERLGSGGQGVVYRALDSRLGRRVALKILRETADSALDARSRFQREAQITSRLEHAGICPVYEVGVHEDRPFIAMRLVDGEPLSRLLAEARDRRDEERTTRPRPADASPGPRARTATQVSPFTWTGIVATLRLIEKVARALDVAHAANVLHRDVKPGNILVGRDGEPVLVDFGLARRVGHETNPVSLTGDLLGTPHYMAPEQFALSSEGLDGRADVYALGVTLYECLTLRRPFEAPTREGLLQAISRADITSCRRLNPAVPPDLEIVVLTALERDRDRRYATAADLVEDLGRLRERRPILARPLPRWLRIRRWVRRYPGVAAVLTILFLAIAAPLAYVLAPGTVRIDSTPPGAVILVDDIETGFITPHDISSWPWIPLRTKVGVRHPDFLEARDTVTPLPFGNATLTLPLVPKRGAVIIGTAQAGVSATLRREGGGERGAEPTFALPTDVLPLDVGTYVLTAKGHGYVDRQQRFEVRLDETVKLQITLERYLLSEPVPGVNVTSLHAGDVDGDGHEDLVIGTDAPASTVVRAWSGADHHELWTRTLALGDLPIGTVDADADGRDDVVVRRLESTSFAILSGLTGRPLREGAALRTYTRNAVVDLDRDGVAEIILFGDVHGVIWIFVVNLRNGTSQTIEIPGVGSSTSVATGDIEGDGDLELLVGTTSGSLVVASHRESSSHRVVPVGRGPISSVAAIDLAGAGRKQAIVATVEPDPRHEESGAPESPRDRATLWTLADGVATVLWQGPESAEGEIPNIVGWRGVSQTRIAVSLKYGPNDGRVEVLELDSASRTVATCASLPLSMPIGFLTEDLDQDGTDELVLAGGASAAGARVQATSAVAVLTDEGHVGIRVLAFPNVERGLLAGCDRPAGGRRDIALLSVSGDLPRKVSLEVLSGISLRGASSRRLPPVAWIAATDNAIWASPAVGDLDGDGRVEVVVAGRDGLVRALSGRDGATRWTYATGRDIWSSPALGDLDQDGWPDVVVGSELDRGKLRGRVHALAGKTGEPLWEHGGIPGEVSCSPTLVHLDGDAVPDVLVGSNSGHLYALSGRDGHELWRFAAGPGSGKGADQRPRAFYARPAIGDLDGDGRREIVAGNWNGMIYVLAEDGSELFRHDMGARVDAEARLVDLNADGTLDIVCASDEGRVDVIDGRTRELLFDVSLSGGVKSSPGIARIDDDDIPDIIVAAEGATGSEAPASRTLYAFSGRDGSEIWRFTAAAGMWSSPVLQELDGDGIQDIIIAGVSKVIHVLSGRDGTLIDELAPGREIYGTPAVADLDGDGVPELVVGTYDHRVYALHLRPHDYRAWRTRVSPIVLARRHLAHGRWRQALAALNDDPILSPAVALIRVRALLGLEKHADAVEVMARTISSGWCSAEFGALHLVLTTLDGGPTDTQIVARSAARDPILFLERLKAADVPLEDCDPTRFRAALDAVLDEARPLFHDSPLLEAVLCFLCGLPVIPDFGRFADDPLGVDVLITMEVLSRVALGRMGSVEADLRLIRLATEAGRRLADPWPRTAPELRQALHLPP